MKALKGRSMTSKCRSKHIKNLCLTLTSGIIMIVIVFPMLYMILNSLMSADEIGKHYADGIKLHIIPDSISFDSYYWVLFKTPDFLLKFWNSLLLSASVVFMQFIVSCLAGFAFAKHFFPGKKALFFMLIVLMLLPLQAVIVPNYIVFDRLNLLNTWWPLIVSGAFTPFGTVLMTQVFKAVPNEIIEAARLDGAGTLRIIGQLMMPMAKGGLISLIILTFIDAWNMVEQPIVFLNDTAQYPLSVFLAFFNSQNLPLSFACGILSLVPGTLLFLYYRDELAEGIEFTGV